MLSLERLAAFLVFFLMVGCASTRSVTDATPHSTAAPTSVASLSVAPAASPSWRYPVPARWDMSQVRALGNTILVGGRSIVAALDPASGRLRWHNNDGASTIMMFEDSVFYATRTGAVVSRWLPDGGLRWKRKQVCPISNYAAPVGGVSVAIQSAANLIVGCNGGRVVRIDRASGRVLAYSNTFVVDQVRKITALGSCAYGVSGWTSGAILVEHTEIVGCKRLNQILPDQDETYIIGLIGGIAVLNDMCCQGRPNVYRPATIFGVSLVTGRLSPKVDLTPEPSRYPADKRPIGQGSLLTLLRGQVYLGVDHTLYWYGDPRALSAPKRIADNLVEPPSRLEDDRLAMRVYNADQSITDQIVRVRGTALETIWSTRDSGSNIFGYDAALTPDILPIMGTDILHYTRFVRTDGSSQLRINDPCQMVGSNRKILVMLCTTKTLVGNRYLQYVAGYRWPK